MSIAVSQNEIDIAVRRIQQDMSDDWHPDLLAGRGIADDRNLRKHILGLLNTEGFLKAEAFDIPKSGFTLRYGLETSLHERILYQAICDSLIQSHDALIDPGILSYRRNTRDSDWMFMPPAREWVRWVATIRQELESGSVLLRTDIQNYFESINVKSLCQLLLESNPRRNSRNRTRIQMLNSMLSAWSPYKGVGIPQNRDPSSFLGNLFLHRIDNEMINSGYRYFRWVDDIMIVCNNRFEARRALNDLIALLRKQHLNVNGKKTEIVDRANHERIVEFLPDPDWRMAEVDELLQQRRFRECRQAIPLLRNLLDVAIDELSDNDRLFRFCLYRIERLQRVNNISFEHERLTDLVVEQLAERPWLSNLFARYLLVAQLTDAQYGQIIEFLTDGERHVYGWQGYHLWTVLGARDNVTEAEISFARERVRSDCNEAERAAVAVFLGRHGNGNDRRNLARRIGNLTSAFTRSSFAIATQQVSERENSDSVRPFLSPSDANRLRWLRSREEPLYYTEPMPLDPESVFMMLPGERVS